MSSFTTPLVVSPLKNGRDWRLCKSFVYHIGSKFSRHYIKVPSGFVTDFASIPRIFWSIIPPWGRYGKAAVVHDYLYQQHLTPRKYDDDIFMEAMEVLEVDLWRIVVMYYAVRLFGWLTWRSNNKKILSPDDYYGMCQ